MRIFGRSTWVVIALLVAALVTSTGTTAATVSQTIPFTYEGSNPCAAFELFAGTGTLHTTAIDNASTSGTVRYYLSSRIDGLQAVTVAGKKYVVQDVFYHQFVISGATEDTFDITAHYVRAGEDGTLVAGDDFYEYMRFHITANAQGLVTAFSANTSEMPCQ
jgi:hypothetical protein